jgi:hypothetical protein
MKRVLVALLAALLSFPALAADDGPTPEDMVVLTAGGFVGKPNRGPLNPKRDSLLAALKLDFEHGFALTLGMLRALPQGTVTAKPKEFDKEATFKGPLLSEVLGLMEAAKVKTTFVAVDGYTGYLLPEDIDGSDYILALEADGAPLGIGQQGPLWLLNTRAEGFKPGADGRGSHVWAVVYMHIGE